MADKRKSGLWTRVDRFLLTNFPEMWLMKFLHVASGTLVCAVLMAFIGLLPTVSLTDYPNLLRWLEIMQYLSLAVGGGWAWYYASRATTPNPSMQWAGFKLFVCHLTCLTMIVLPMFCLPAVILQRLARVESEQLDADMMEWFASCACVEEYVRGFPRKLDSDPDLSYADFSCKMWDPFKKLRRHRPCSTSSNPIADEIEIILKVHAKYTSFSKEDRDAVLDFRSRMKAPKRDEPAHLFINTGSLMWPVEVPQQWRRLENLWSAWCRKQSGGRPGCAFETIEQEGVVAYVPRENNNVFSTRPSHAVVGDARLQSGAFYNAVFACLLATFITALRLRVGWSFFRAVLVMAGALFMLSAIHSRTGMFGSSKDFANGFAEGVIALFWSLLVAGLIGRGLIKYNNLPRWLPLKFWIDLTMVACLLAPLVPIGYFGRELLQRVPAKSNFWQYWNDGDMFELAELFLNPSYVAWSSDVAGDFIWGFSLHTVALVAELLLSLLTAFVLMDVWRMVRILPSDQGHD